MREIRHWLVDVSMICYYSTTRDTNTVNNTTSLSSSRTQQKKRRRNVCHLLIAVVRVFLTLSLCRSMIPSACGKKPMRHLQPSDERQDTTEVARRVRDQISTEEICMSALESSLTRCPAALSAIAGSQPPRTLATLAYTLPRFIVDLQRVRHRLIGDLHDLHRQSEHLLPSEGPPQPVLRYHLRRSPLAPEVTIA